MKKKICPYCDQVMKHSCFCSFCRRLVFHPEEQEINYYLNERHPQHEEDCSYHGGLPGEQEGGGRASSTGNRPAAAGRGSASPPGRGSASLSGKNPATPAGRGSAPTSGNRPAPAAGNRPASASPAPTTRMASSAKKPYQSLNPTLSPKPAGAKGRQKWALVKAALVIYVIFMVLGGFDKFKEGFRPKMTPEPGNVESGMASSTSPDDTAYEPETDLSPWERTDEQVKKAGVACNAYGHLPVSFKELSSAIISQLNAADYIVSPWSQWSINEDMESYTSFNTYYDCDIFQKDEYSGDLGLLYDTATGEFHGLVIYSGDQEEIRRISKGVIDAFRSLNVFSEETDAEQTLDSLFENAQVDTTMLLETDGLEITLRIYSYEGEEDYCISFYSAGYYTDLS